MIDKVNVLAGQWEEFAQELGIKEGKIKTIRADHVGNALMALNDAVSDWFMENHEIQRFGKPSWKTLVNAVKPLDRSLAHEIAEKHPKGL